MNFPVLRKKEIRKKVNSGVVQQEERETKPKRREKRGQLWV